MSIIYEVNDNVKKAYEKGYEKANKEWQDKIRNRKKELEKENEEEPDVFRQVIIIELENLLKESE